MGSFEYPLIFALHGFRINDRERDTFYKMDVIKVIRQTVEKLTPEVSVKVLKLLKDRWYDRPQKQYDFETYYSIIKALVHNAAKSPEEKDKLKREYPNLLVAHQIKKSDLLNYNRRRQALAWLRSTEKKYRLVQDGFEALGYSTLEQACEAGDGFCVIRDPKADELGKINLLEKAVSTLMPELIDFVNHTPCKIIKSKHGVWGGMATCLPLKDARITFRGINACHYLSYIALKEHLFDKNSFGSALSTYLHELSHIFGSDGSGSFSKALTEILDIAIMKSNVIKTFQLQWEAISNKQLSY